MRLLGKIALWLLAAVVIIGIAGYAATQLSPWPKALLIRYAFDKDGARTQAALAKYMPTNVSSERDIAYAEGDPDAHLDVFYPSDVKGTDRVLPTIVWTHGGGWISGSKNDMANYVTILAGHGYTVLSLDYSIAPGATYPTPLRQVNEALGFIVKNAARLHVDTAQIVLAGDSAGAQITAQIANIVAVPSYAAALGITPTVTRNEIKGVILYCGAYDLALAQTTGPYVDFIHTVLWSYSGTRDFATDPRFATLSVTNYVTADFPAAFISAGNADPLLAHSTELAEVLAGKGVAVDSLFFPADTTPPLPHEYQFNLDGDPGQQALTRSLAFLARLMPPAP